MADDVKKPEDEKNITANEAPANETPAQTNEQLNLDSDTPPPDKTAEDSAALAQEKKSVPGDNLVTYDFNTKNQATQDKPPQGDKIAEQKPKEEKPPEAPKRRGRPSNSNKAAQAENPNKDSNADQKPKPDKPAKEKSGAGGSKKATGEEKPKSAVTAEKEPEPPAPPPEPTTAPRAGEQEQIVYINLIEIHPFKDHPFQVKEDAEMTAMVESVRDKGVTQPAILRPREEGGYEMVSGHRRHKASELANYTNMPCIVRNLTDEQAITQMVEDNTNQRESILPSERGAALKMQLEAIKRQGARDENGGNGKRSNEIVAERNKMTVKQVQRYIKLTELVPDLAKMVDEKQIAFTPAVEIAHIKPANQNYIAIAIEGNQSAPSLSQAQRLRELDQKNVLNPDMIDGILMEEKKEVDKVILSSKELSQYFGNDKTPREMKDAIIKLLDEHKAKNPPELGKDKQPKPPER